MNLQQQSMDDQSLRKYMNQTNLKELVQFSALGNYNRKKLPETNHSRIKEPYKNQNEMAVASTERLDFDEMRESNFNRKMYHANRDNNRLGQKQNETIIMNQ